MPSQQQSTSRRHFMWTLGSGAAALASSVSIGCSSRDSRTSQDDAPPRGATGGVNAPSRSSAAPAGFVTRAAHALGTKVRLTIAPPPRASADQVCDAVFATLNEIEDVMSLYRPHSQLRELNRTGRLDAADPRLIEVLRAARSISDESQGAFDITVQPLWKMYSHAQHQSASGLPAPEDRTRALEQVGYDRVEIEGRQVRLRGEGVAVTLNGIAQGYALDAAKKTLDKFGVTDALFDTGELGALGDKSGQPWRTGVQHPNSADGFAAIAEMDGRCLATSGDYATTFSDDRTFHHLLDPRTGHSPTELSSVSVVAPTGLLADALSTAVFVMGPVAGMELIKSTPNVDAMLITKGQQSLRLVTQGFPLAKA